MKFKTQLIGQQEIEKTFNTILDDPPHIFITGMYGSGKSTIIKEFIQTYYDNKNINNRSKWIMNLSSEKDRGIHCVRQNVAEFVHHSSAKEGIYRWIIIDDADSLPIISQQALRRPMETHAHTTRFIFCSRYPSDLIPPLKSRCLHLELETISTIDYIDYSLTKNNTSFVLSKSALQYILILGKSPSQVETIIQLLSLYYIDKKEIHYEDVHLLFGSPSYNTSSDIIKSFIKKEDKDILKLFFRIWSTGISYEDFLYELTLYIKQLGVLKSNTYQKLYYLIMKGWIQFAQNKTHSFDMLRLILQL